MATETLPILDNMHSEPISYKYGFGIVSLAMSFFVCINVFVSSQDIPKAVNPKDAWKFRNLFISWIHALIVGTWDILCFFLYPELTLDLIDYHNFFLYSMVAFSTGYFFYDFLDIVRHNGSNSSWEILMHHMAVSSMFFYNLMQSRCIPYNVVALMAEINSFFLHSRKLMLMMHVSFSSPVYRVNVYANIVSFVLGRFCSLAWIVYGMVMWHSRVPQAYMYCLSVAIFVMWGINLVLFQRIIKNDLLRPPVSETNGVDHTAANNNGVKAVHATVTATHTDPRLTHRTLTNGHHPPS